jgi:hypothetical protein
MRKVNPPATPTAVEHRYQATLGRVLSQCHDLDEPWVIELDKDAQTALTDHLEAVESGLLNHLEPIAEWGNKLAGRLIRIAAIFAVVRAVDEHSKLPTTVTAPDLELAWGLKEYLCDHALHAFQAMDSDSVVGKAEVVWSKIKCFPIPEFTARDVFQAVKARSAFNKMADLWPALKVLEDHGHIQRKDQKEGTPGRRSTVYEKHPDVHY